jgi:hypothetical protein
MINAPDANLSIELHLVGVRLRNHHLATSDRPGRADQVGPQRSSIGNARESSQALVQHP